MITGFATPSPHPLSGGLYFSAVEMNNTCKAAEIFGASESYSVGRVVELELSVLNEGQREVGDWDALGCGGMTGEGVLSALSAPNRRDRRNRAGSELILAPANNTLSLASLS